MVGTAEESSWPPELDDLFARERLERAVKEATLFLRQASRSAAVPSGPAMRDYAEHVGYVIMQAADADLRFAALAALLHHNEDGYPAKMLALSGRRLADALMTSRVPLPDDFDSLVTRYEAAYRRRNQIVHAIRPHGDRDADAERFEMTVRPTPTQPQERVRTMSVASSIETITVEELIEFEFELQLLSNAASQWFQALTEAGLGESSDPGLGTRGDAH
ncbi:hypothetical protein [Pedococcus sp. 2YAF34]|uniref:hypothetical protein n=1 Tax=Pedococcus sp. 2YAF34 TaxID=3233032 RepID=UPI003F9C6D91